MPAKSNLALIEGGGRRKKKTVREDSTNNADKGESGAQPSG
jgi:hypothetical protein